MDIEQRILRRMWLIDNLALLLGEVNYHRDHQATFAAVGPPQQLWRLDTESGAAHVVAE